MPPRHETAAPVFSDSIRRRIFRRPQRLPESGLSEMTQIGAAGFYLNLRYLPKQIAALRMCFGAMSRNSHIQFHHFGFAYRLGNLFHICAAYKRAHFDVLAHEIMFARFRVQCQRIGRKFGFGSNRMCLIAVDFGMEEHIRRRFAQTVAVHPDVFLQRTAQYARTVHIKPCLAFGRRRERFCFQGSIAVAHRYARAGGEQQNGGYRRKGSGFHGFPFTSDVLVKRVGSRIVVFCRFLSKIFRIGTYQLETIFITWMLPTKAGWLLFQLKNYRDFLVLYSICFIEEEDNLYVANRPNS